MGMPVVTVSAGGLPVVETPFGAPVTEATNGYGVPITKVVGKPGLPVTFETLGIGGDPPGNWVTTFTAVMGGDSPGWSGWNMRQMLPISVLTQNGTKIRITFAAGSSGEGMQIASCWAGHAAGAGDPYDFDGSQVQVKFSGGSNTVLIPFGTTFVSDAVTYAFDKTKVFIIAVYFNNAANDITRQSSITGATNYSKAGADEGSVSNVSAYTTVANNIARMASKIEVFQPL